MKKLIPALLLACIAGLWGCRGNRSVEFVITNRSDFELTDVSITVHGSVKKVPSISIGIGETGNYHLNADDLPKRDGSYFLRYKKARKDSFEMQKFGYFSNGNPLEETIPIIIENDTVLINSDNNLEAPR